MARRAVKNVTGLRGTGVVDYTKVYRVFECGRPGCDFILKVEDGDATTPVRCQKCGYPNGRQLLDRASRWKYCRLCEQMQPLENFHRHKSNRGSFRSGRQLECRTCKNTLINPHLNPLRTRDQHREASERRRLHGLLADEQKVKYDTIYERFEGKCFNCRKRVSKKEGKLDHTLPAKFLWPLQNGPTLLCSKCNNEKHDKWPSEYYREEKLRKLSVVTGIEHEMLAGAPQVNPAAVEHLLANADEFIERWIRYPGEIKRIRNLVLEKTGKDLYKVARVVPDFLADA